MTRIKRLLSSLVACCMVLMLLPVSALAANTANRDRSEEHTSELQSQR